MRRIVIVAIACALAVVGLTVYSRKVASWAMQAIVDMGDGKRGPLTDGEMMQIAVSKFWGCYCVFIIACVAAALVAWARVSLARASRPAPGSGPSTA